MTHDQIIREEFERWFTDQGATPGAATRSATNPEGYRLMQAQSAWIAWKAAWAVAEGYSA